MQHPKTLPQPTGDGEGSGRACGLSWHWKMPVYWAQSPRKASERDQSRISLLPSWGLASPSMRVESTEVLAEPLGISLPQLLPHPPAHEQNKCERFASNPPFPRASLLCLPHPSRAQLSGCGVRHQTLLGTRKLGRGSRFVEGLLGRTSSS